MTQLHFGPYQSTGDPRRALRRPTQDACRRQRIPRRAVEEPQEAGVRKQNSRTSVCRGGPDNGGEDHATESRGKGGQNEHGISQQRMKI